MNSRMNEEIEQQVSHQEHGSVGSHQFAESETSASAPHHSPGLGSSRSSFERSSLEHYSQQESASRRKKEKKEKKAKKHKKKHKKHHKKSSKSRLNYENSANTDSALLESSVSLHVSEASALDLKRQHHGTLNGSKSAWRTDHHSGTTANTAPITPNSSGSPQAEKKKMAFSQIMEEQEAARQAEEEQEHDPTRAKELEAMGLSSSSSAGETDEERMVRMAMEMSLNEFTHSPQDLLMEQAPPKSHPYHPTAAVRSAQRIPYHDEAEICGDDSGDIRDDKSNSTLEMTEVVVDDPRGKVKSRRRMSTRNLASTSTTRLLEGGGAESKPPTRTEYFDDDPKAQFDEEPEPEVHGDDPFSHWDEADLRKKFFDEEFDEEMFTEVPRRPARSVLPDGARRTPPGRRTRPVEQIRPIDQIRLARQNLSAQEAEEIERALREAGEDAEQAVPRRRAAHITTSPTRQDRGRTRTARRQPAPAQSSPGVQVAPSEHLSPDEAAEIAKALQEADEAEARKSFQLALQLQSQEATLYTSERKMRARQQTPQGNVRTVSQAEQTYAAQQAAQVGAVRTYSPPVTRHPLDEHHDDDNAEEPGYRINSSRPSQHWARVRDHVVGPDGEVRTKHDAELQAQSNARRLGLDEEEEGFIGNTAYNSFRQSMQRHTVKGVAAHGHGRATSDTDKTKSGAMDPRVRMLITRAINNRLIEKCNGIVREGKEAVIYHADQGEEGGGYDVAIKVFKRIQEFRGRGDYVDGDPRYGDSKFRNAGNREQLEMWAEKEYRNLLRANRSGVPVPTPLIQKENVVFMRFLGEDGWAVPQLKDLQLRKGSEKWTTLYSQIMVAVRRLFHGARLVHGDLSEYNILVCPARLVENRDEGFGPSDDNELQAVLIDFGQSVDWRHPSALELLERDLSKMRDFFMKKGVKTLALPMAMEFVTAPEPDQEDESSIVDDDSKVGAVGTATSATVNGTSAQQTFPTQAARDAVSGQSTDFTRAPGDSWGKGADAFQGSSGWPPEFE